MALFLVPAAAAAAIELTSTIPVSSGGATHGRADAVDPAKASESFARLPLMFEPTDGSGSGFLCRGPGYYLFLSPWEAALSLHQAGGAEQRMRTGPRGLLDARVQAASPSAPAAALLRIRLVGANAAAPAVGLEPLPTKANYFLGNDPRQWRTGIETFAKVFYRGVYPGIDLIYYGNQRQLEYDFVVEPGASVSRILLRFDGVETMELDSRGELILQTAVGRVRQHCPLVYQEVDGRRKEVSGRYALRCGDLREVSFEVGAYDRSRPLIIDPVLVYSTFLGGTGLDVGWGIAVDGTGSVYVAGETASTNFPINNASSNNFGGGLRDVFVAKLDPAGTNLVYSTYLGGTDEDVAFGIAVDGSGNVFLAGATASTNFPVTTNAVSTNLHGAPAFGYYSYDAFVVKLDAGGAALLYSTYLGGSQADVANVIAVDGSGKIYVAGATSSADFPTNGTTTILGGGYDGFVAKLDPGSTNLVYSTYLGGAANDYVFGLGVDSAGYAIVAGLTASLDFPVTNALQTNFAGGPFDGFVTRLSPDGSSRLFSTYLGGNGDDEISHLALDTAGSIYLSGLTTSTNFPVVTALYATNHGQADAFVLKLDSSGTNLIYSTYLGGAGNDQAWGIAVDSNGSAHVVGSTSSSDFPTTNSFQAALGGLDDVFVAKLNPNGTALDYSTFLGGIGNDEGHGIALDGAGNAYITGQTFSVDFPVYPTTNGVETAFGGGTGDAFVVKLFPRNATLRATRGVGSSSSDVTIFWARGLPDFEVESAGGFQGTNTTWTMVTNTPVVVGDDNTLTFTNSMSNQFFRLRRIR